jgi:hypothetical protein
MDTAPVQDWTTDYDIFDHTYVTDPYGIWAEMRAQCPVVRTERWGGSWMPVTSPPARALR